MQWLKRRVFAWVNSVHRDDLRSGPMTHTDDSLSDGSIRFYLTPAVGGRILKVVREEQSKNYVGSNSNSVIYVIPSGEDVGERVSKIINLELIK